MEIFEQMIAKIKQYDTIIIHRHVKPDPDAIGTQLGLAQLIRDNFNKTVYCVGENLEGLQFIGQMDSITDEVYNGALVIVVDTANMPRIDDNRYYLGDYLIKIDHHPNLDKYGDLQYVETQASSTSEIIVDLARSQRLILSDETARLLYSGIVGDTGRFLYDNATAKTMEQVAFLRRFAFSASDINYQMITKSLEMARLNGYLLQQLQVSENGVAHVIITQKVLTAFHVKDEHVSALVSQPGSIEGVVCWGIFVEQAQGGYRCRLRSKGPAINEIAQRHDGGGHAKASGANAKDLAEINEILGELNEVAKQYAKGENK